MPLIVLLLTLCAITAPAIAQTQPAARVVSVEGTAMLDRGGQRRIVGVGEGLEERDVISVAGASHAMIEFRDQTRVTLRPNTMFRVNAYADSGSESVLLGLLKGGVRAVTGLVGKRNPAAVRVETTTATIGIRGTEFDVRLCENDCATEERARPVARAGLPVAARLVEMDGVAAAAQSGGNSRVLVPGAALHELESIATGPGSYAVIAFGDGSRMTLAADTVLGIEHFRYDPSRPERGSAALRLSQGGLRVLTGLIAQKTPAAYRIDTAMGRVEARGTLFDTVCTGECAELGPVGRDALARLKTEMPAEGRKDVAPEKAAETGLVVHAIDGLVVLGTADGELEVKSAQAASVRVRGAKPVLATTLPAFTAPRPDTVLIDPSIFGLSGPDYEPGLHVWVREGSIALEQDIINQRSGEWRIIRAAALQPRVLIVTAGNAAFANRDRLTPLPFVPNFLRLDLVPRPLALPASFVLPFFRMPDGSKAAMCTTP